MSVIKILNALVLASMILSATVYADSQQKNNNLKNESIIEMKEELPSREKIISIAKENVKRDSKKYNVNLSESQINVLSEAVADYRINMNKVTRSDEITTITNDYENKINKILSQEQKQKIKSGIESRKE